MLKSRDIAENTEEAEEKEKAVFKKKVLYTR